jgi:hypothetical protein
MEGERFAGNWLPLLGAAHPRFAEGDGLTSISCVSFFYGEDLMQSINTNSPFYVPPGAGFSVPVTVPISDPVTTPATASSTTGACETSNLMLKLTQPPQRTRQRASCLDSHTSFIHDYAIRRINSTNKLKFSIRALTRELNRRFFNRLDSLHQPVQPSTVHRYLRRKNLLQFWS